MRTIILLCLLISVFICKNKETISEEKVITNHLPELFTLTQGSFDSQIQSQVDTTYYNITLHMYPIWEDKENFTYVEQALNTKQDKPYRQSIYEVTQLNDSMYSSAIYTIENDSLWISKWKTPKDFNTLTMDNVSKKEGCEVILQRIEPNFYKGETGVKTCESSLYDASYATSEVEIMEDNIISWDRGFDNEDVYVWGAEKGGYIFNKLD